MIVCKVCNDYRATADDGLCDDCDQNRRLKKAYTEGFRAGLEAAADWVEENVAVACDSVDTAAAIRDLAVPKP